MFNSSPRCGNQKSQTSPTEEGNGHISDEIKEKVKVIKYDELPFLDMKMAWEAKKLSFGICQKKGPEIEVYPDHAGIVQKAGLVLEEFPTLGKIWEDAGKASAAEKTSKKKHLDKRTTFL
eukprot:15365964-Ditylum_brightwellii.AAC.1